jgi:hemolysin III
MTVGQPNPLVDQVEHALAAAAGQVTAQVAEVADQVSQHVRQQVAAVKPRLRGWLHAAATPIALLAGLVAVLSAPTGTSRAAAAVFTGTAAAQYAVSAVYNIGSFSPRTALLLRRLDHAGIFVLIAGSCTPFALLLLEGGARAGLLAIAWGGACVGVVFKVVAPHAPRWVSTPAYVALGWAAVFFLPAFAQAATPAVVALIVAGGLLYTGGAVVYGLRRPNPAPTWFGFHEVFHAATVLAFAAHYASLLLATQALR